jgi:hypothetical protein
VQSLLESVEYHPIGTLDLSIDPRGWATETYLAVLPKLLIVEVGARVCDDAVA